MEKEVDLEEVKFEGWGGVGAWPEVGCTQPLSGLAEREASSPWETSVGR